MEVEALSKRLADLPEWAQQEVAEFIAVLEAQRGRFEAAPHRPLSEEPFVGLWKDRDDLSDSSAWVRDIRRREWMSRHG